MLRFDGLVSTLLIVGVVGLFFAVCMLWWALVPENLDHTPNPEMRAVYEKRPDNHFEPVSNGSSQAFGFSAVATEGASRQSFVALQFGLAIPLEDKPQGFSERSR